MLYWCGYVVDVVDGLIERSICVDVSSETETFALKIIEHVLARIVLRAVESHVLEEVGETELLRCLECGSHLLGNVEVGTLLGLLVVEDVIVQAVVKLAVAHLRIQGHRRLGLGAQCCRKQHDYAENFLNHILSD